jgi:hypothetical protein
MPRKWYAPYLACAAGLKVQPMTATLQQFPPLESVNRPAVDTAAAAHYLNRRPQTMRIWALTGHPIQPRRINGRLAWPVALSPS